MDGGGPSETLANVAGLTKEAGAFGAEIQNRRNLDATDDCCSRDDGKRADSRSVCGDGKKRGHSRRPPITLGTENLSRSSRRWSDGALSTARQLLHESFAAEGKPMPDVRRRKPPEAES